MKTLIRLLSFILSFVCTSYLQAQEFIRHEDFEKGSKSSYTEGALDLNSGRWIFRNALIGNLETDHKNGEQCARLTGSADLTMDFDMENNVSMIDVHYAVYGNDAGSDWLLRYSVDKGQTWDTSGMLIHAFSPNLTIAHFDLNALGTVRIQIHKIRGARLNIDDIFIRQSELTTTATRDNNMLLGNPSNALSELKSANNYLVTHPQFTLSYNNAIGIPNWVSWHMSSSWKGLVDRCDCFHPDDMLPDTFFHAVTDNYSKCGFDRGHVCPSDDRDANEADNEATFLMDNIIPQSPKVNRGCWKNFETYCRGLTEAGNELYIISGGYGTGGTGSAGKKEKIAGRIRVPAHCWKIVVVLPVGNNDLKRISSGTRIIAIDIPNQETAAKNNWFTYRTSVDAIEQATGYNFLTALPPELQSKIESRTDAVTVNN